MKKLRIILTIIIALLIPVYANAESSYTTTTKNISHYCQCKYCCQTFKSGDIGKVKDGGGGVTASGARVSTNNSMGIVAAPSSIKTGTILYLPACGADRVGRYVIVGDRGGLGRIDVFVSPYGNQGGNTPYKADHNYALSAGVIKNQQVKVYDIVISGGSNIQEYSCSQEKMRTAVTGTAAISNTPAQEQLPEPPKEVDVIPDFNIMINGQLYSYISGNFEVNVDELPSEIALIDQSSHSNKVVQWRLWNPGKGEMENLGKDSWQTVKLLQGAQGHFNETGTIGVGLIVEGGKSKVIEIKFNVTKPVEDIGLVLKGINYGGTERVIEYTGEETIVISDLKEVVKEVEFVNKSNKNRYPIEWRVWNENKQEVEKIDCKQVNIMELIERCGRKQEDGRYKMRIGMTLNDGRTYGEDMYFSKGEFVIGLGQGEAGKGESKENAILVGSIPVNLEIINKSGIKVIKYEVWNQHTNQFDELSGTSDTQWIHIESGTTGLFVYDKDYTNTGIVNIAIRMVLEDGTVSTRDVYFKKLMQITPLEAEVISENKDLLISWKDMGKGIKYAVRVVRYEGDKVYEIYGREIVEGTSFVVPKEKLEEGKDYRIAIQPDGGWLYSIRTVTTNKIEMPEITNMKEGEIVEAGKDLKIEMKKELVENEKYYVTLYNKENKMIVLIVGKDNKTKEFTINGKYLNAGEKYIIEVKNIREYEYGGEKVVVSSEPTNITINVK